MALTLPAPEVEAVVLPPVGMAAAGAILAAAVSVLPPLLGAAAAGLLEIGELPGAEADDEVPAPLPAPGVPPEV